MDYNQIVEESMENFRAVFSKPQFENFKNFINGIIKTEHRRTIFHINKGSETMKDQSQLNRFITDPKWVQSALRRSYVDFAIKKVIDKSGRYVFFVFDETIKSVSTGNSKIEAVGKYFDHSQNRFVYGHKVFTSCITNGFGFTVPNKLELFIKKSDAKKLGMKYRKITKMAEETVDEFAKIETKGKTKVLLFDTYYAAKKILARISELGMNFVTRIKSNRKIIINGKTTNARNLPKLLPVAGEVKIKGQTYQYAEPQRVELYNFGPVYIMWSKPLDSEKFQYYITDMKLDGKSTLKMYGNRWEIETMHKDLKQNFGFADYRLRRITSVSAYSLLCIVVYGIISVIRSNAILKYMAEVPKRIIRKIKRFFTLGKICNMIRTKRQVDVKLLDNTVRFIMVKNAKL